jgi:hypothetical protein
MSRVAKVRNYISPSDLSFNWEKCPRCFWLKYKAGISAPGFMPLVGPMAAFQEALYQEQKTTQISESLKPGKVMRWGRKVSSSPIVINGAETAWRIEGKYDAVVEFDDSTLGVIDCKVTTGDMDRTKIELYWAQLEAYAFALENPSIGDSETVSETGLLIWKIVGAETDHLTSYKFHSEMQYLSAGRQPDRFNQRIREVIELLDGQMPDENDKCENCNYHTKRRSRGA